MLEGVISKKVKDAVLIKVWPIIDHIGHWLDDSYDAISQEHWMYLVSNARRGDILLSRSANPFSNLFIPGKVTHASVITSENPSWPTVVEAVALKRKVIESSLYDFLKSKRLLIHCRPKFISKEGAGLAADFAKELIGTAYDKVFSLKNEELYCSELVRVVYQKAYSTTIPKDYDISFPLKTKVRYGEEMYLPDDIRLDSDNWEVVWSNIK